MKLFFQQIKWQFILLSRNYIIAISVAVTLAYAAIFFAIKDLGNMEKMLTLLILNDPAIIGLFFIGVSLLMERRQQVLSALFVSPMDHHMYLWVRILSLTLVGWGCALGMAIAAIGVDFHLLPFSVAVIGICILACLLGIFVVSDTDEFLLFMLKSVPFLILLNLPLFNYFGVTDWTIMYLSPVQACLILLDNSYGNPVELWQLIYAYASMLVWPILLYAWVYRVFTRKIVNV